MSINKSDANPTYEPSSQYTVRHITMADGLKSKRVQAFATDKNGLLWIANGDFLLSFDGLKFHDLSRNIKNPNDQLGSIGYFNRSRNNDLVFQDGKHRYRSAGSFDIRVIGPSISISSTYIQIPFEEQTNHIDYAKSALMDYTRAYRQYHQIPGPLFYTKKVVSYDPHTHLEKLLGTYKGLAKGFCVHHDTIHLFTDKKLFTIINNKLHSVSKGKINKESDLTYEDVNRVYWVNQRYFIYAKSGLYSLQCDGNGMHTQLLIPKKLLPKTRLITMESTQDGNTLFLSDIVDGFYICKRVKFESAHHPDSCHPSMNSLLLVNDTLFTNNSFYWTNDLKQFGYLERFPLESYDKDYVTLGDDELLFDRADHRAGLIYNRKGIHTRTEYHRCIFGTSIPGDQNEIRLLFMDSTFTYRNHQFQYLPLTIPIPIKDVLRSVNCGAWFNDTFWVGTKVGVFGYAKNSSRPCIYSLRNMSVRSILKDPSGKVMFLFTYGNGIYQYANRKFVRMPAWNNFMNFSHYAIIDSINRIWIPTNSGLFIADYEEWKASFNSKIPAYVYRFGTSDGLFSDELNGGTSHSSIYAPEKRKYYLSSTEGPIAFNPNQTFPELPRFPIQLTQLSLDGINMPLENTVKGNFNVMHVQFTTSYFTDHNNLKYQYSLDGKEWKHVFNEEVTLYRSSPGDYELKIRLQTDLKGQHFIYYRLPYTILPYFYEKTSFYIGLGFLLLLIIQGVYFWVKFSERKEKERLNETIRLRTADLEDALSELRVSELSLQENIKLKENTIKVLAHDMRSPLYAVQFLIGHIQSRFNKQQDNTEEINEEVNQVGKAINSLIKLSNDFMIWYNLSNPKNLLKTQAVDLVDSISEIVRLHESTALTKEKRIECMLPDSYFIHSDPQLIKMVIRNLVDNALKYTTSKNIVIELQELPEQYLFIRNHCASLTPEQLVRMRSLLKDESIPEWETDGWVGIRLVGFICRYLKLPCEYTFSNDMLTFKLTIPHE